MSGKERIYHCFKCNKFYPRYRIFKLHLMKCITRSKREKIQCESCPTRFGSQVLKEMHKFNQHMLPKCKLCGVECVDKDELIQHCFTHNFLNQWPYKCSLCEKGFTTAFCLALHISICDSQQVNPYFNMSFQIENIFGDINSKENPMIACRKCDVKVPTYHQWIRHQNFVHSGEKKENEEQSTKEKVIDENIEINQGEHSYAKGTAKKKRKIDMQYQCGICEKYYKDENSLERHIKMSHMANNDKLRCDICDIQKKFRSKLEYQAHIASHKGEQILKCDVCNRSFQSSYVLRVHMLTIHERDKLKFKCFICDQKFMYKSTLKTHMNKHTKEKAYVCGTCGKIFYERRFLREHEKRHNDEYRRKRNDAKKKAYHNAQYICEYCGKVYSSKYHVKHQKCRKSID